MKKMKTLRGIIWSLALTALFGGAVLAASNPTLTQSITVGVLATDILDASRVPVASPSAAMSTKAFSFDCQTGGNASTGTLGTNTERVYAMNPAADNNGFTLTIAATAGPTAKWANGAVTNTYDFNDPTTSGCTDGAGDADTLKGQLTVDPSVSTLTTDCASCTTTGITKGSATGFNQGTIDAITLINAAGSSDDIWRGYLTGIGLSQTIPAETPADSYSVNFTVTITGL